MPGPSDEEVADLITAIAHAIIQDLRLDGRLAPVEAGDEVEQAPPLEQVFAQSEQLAAAAAASASLKVAFGPRSGRRVRRIGQSFDWEDDEGMVKGKRCAAANGFSLHADRYL